MKKEDKACPAGNLGCSANYIWFGLAVFLFIIAAAMIFGN